MTHLIDPEEVHYEEHPESTSVQLLWLLPGLFLLGYILGHLLIA